MLGSDIGSSILCSSITLIAFNVNERFYESVHYMWCTPFFDIDHRSPVYTVPPTSSPFQIYKTLARKVANVDCHSDKIEANRVGIIRGAQKNVEAGAKAESFESATFSEIFDFSSATTKGLKGQMTEEDRQDAEALAKEFAVLPADYPG